MSQTLEGLYPIAYSPDAEADKVRTCRVVIHLEPKNTHVLIATPGLAGRAPRLAHHLSRNGVDGD